MIINLSIVSKMFKNFNKKSLKILKGYKRNVIDEVFSVSLGLLTQQLLRWTLELDLHFRPMSARRCFEI